MLFTLIKPGSALFAYCPFPDYRIYPKYWDILISYCSCVDPDQTPHSAAFGLSLHCFLRPVCPNTYVYYSKIDAVYNILLWTRYHYKIEFVKTKFYIIRSLET